MPTSTVWDAIEREAARRYALANSPANVAVHAIGDLRSALDQLAGPERDDVLELLRSEVPAAAECGLAASLA